MRILKTALFVSVLLILTSCTCRLRHVGPGSNIAMATDGGPLRDVNFAFDSFKLDAQAKTIIASNVDWLQDNDDATVTIEGHCDERGTTEYNMALGANRAKVVFDSLVAGGIAADRLSTVSYGEELPLDPAHNETAWAKNRRVHFSVKE